jgi:hypothetical protein
MNNLNVNHFHYAFHYAISKFLRKSQDIINGIGVLSTFVEELNFLVNIH